MQVTTLAAYNRRPSPGEGDWKPPHCKSETGVGSSELLFLPWSAHVSSTEQCSQEKHSLIIERKELICCGCCSIGVAAVVCFVVTHAAANVIISRRDDV